MKYKVTQVNAASTSRRSLESEGKRFYEHLPMASSNGFQIFKPFLPQ
jgi:hypothetical protein